MYCTVDQARAAGCTGTDLEVESWIALAQSRVDAFTQQVFEPTDMTVAADIGPDGLILLPRRVRSVSAVVAADAMVDGGGVEVPAAAYRVTSSAVLGDVDAVQLYLGGYDDLIAGAESYNGGWAGLWERYGADRVQVTGSFGYDTPPPGVDLATALVAAYVQGVTTGTTAADGTAPAGGVDTDDEGNNVAITDEAGGATTSPAAPTTGSAQADTLLAQYHGGPPLLAGV